MTHGDDTARRGKGGGRDPAFEAALGARLQAARVAAKMSQSALGAAVGISFQQVQKYEKGKDRVAASTLAAFAAALGVHPGSFFGDGVPGPRTGAEPAPRVTLSDLRSAQRLGERIEQVRNPNVVRRLMALVDAIVEAQDDEAPADNAEANGHAPDDGGS